MAGQTLAAQLEPMLRGWAEAVQREAAESVFAATQALCPVDTGQMLASGTLEAAGALAWRITYDDQGYTDVGPVAHEIRGNPLLVFDWYKAGLYPAVFASVQWVPGEGVAFNKGWFSERACSDDTYEQALTLAAETISLDAAA